MYTHMCMHAHVCLCPHMCTHRETTMLSYFLKLRHTHTYTRTNSSESVHFYTANCIKHVSTALYSYTDTEKIPVDINVYTHFVLYLYITYYISFFFVFCFFLVTPTFKYLFLLCEKHTHTIPKQEFRTSS